MEEGLSVRQIKNKRKAGYDKDKPYKLHHCTWFSLAKQALSWGVYTECVPPCVHYLRSVTGKHMAHTITLLHLILL